ncbi:hypothetical protein PGH45_00195 [Legionella pneumophila]|nr:hypothetical protein [Legionella pneumophila]
MRAASDVILTSAKTVQMDNPRMNARLDTGLVAKPVAIVDRNLSLSDDTIIFDSKTLPHLSSTTSKSGKDLS